MANVQKVCEVCGKSFEVWASRALTAKTCSQKCRGVLIAKGYEEARAKKVCPVCKVEFSVPQCHAERTTYCSRACSDPIPRSGRMKGSSHYMWHGGRAEHSDGYLYMTAEGHPFARIGKYVFEHRLVVESLMRKKSPGHKFMVEVDGELYLRPEVSVHHINGNKHDNRPENLLACTNGAHQSIHNGKAPMQGEVWPEIKGLVPFTPYRVSLICQLCGSAFTLKRSAVARGAGKFCSRDCYNKRPRESFDIITTRP